MRPPGAKGHRGGHKYLLSSHYQGTPYDPYGSYGDQSLRGKYRPIGINRTDLLSINCIRPGKPADCAAVQWLCFGSNAFNVALPIYSQVPQVPEYLSCTGPHADTGSFYWVSRLIAALADGSYKGSLIHIERYQLSAAAEARRILNHYDGLLGAQEDPDKRLALRLQANPELARTPSGVSARRFLTRSSTSRSNVMKNAYAQGPTPEERNQKQNMVVFFDLDGTIVDTKTLYIPHFRPSRTVRGPPGEGAHPRGEHRAALRPH